MSSFSKLLRGVVAATTITITAGCSSLNADFQSSANNQARNAFDKSLSDLIKYEVGKYNLDDFNTPKSSKYASEIASTGKINEALANLENNKALLLESPIAGIRQNRILMVDIETTQEDVNNAFNTFYGEKVTTDYNFKTLDKDATPAMSVRGTETIVTFKNGDTETVNIQRTTVGNKSYDNLINLLDKRYSDIHNKESIRNKKRNVDKYVDHDLASTVDKETRNNNFQIFIVNHELAHAFGSSGGFNPERLEKKNELNQLSGDDYQYSKIEEEKHEDDKLGNHLDYLIKYGGTSDDNTSVILNGEVIADAASLLVTQEQLPNNEWEALKEDVIKLRTSLSIDFMEHKYKDGDYPSARSKSLNHETSPIIFPMLDMIDKHRANPIPEITKFSENLTKASLFSYVINDEVQRQHGESFNKILNDGGSIRDVAEDIIKIRKTGEKVLSSDNGLGKIISRTSDIILDSIGDEQIAAWMNINNSPELEYQAPETSFEQTNAEPEFNFGNPEAAKLEPPAADFNKLSKVEPPNNDNNVSFVFEGEDKLNSIAENLQKKPESLITQAPSSNNKLNL